MAHSVFPVAKLKKQEESELIIDFVSIGRKTLNFSNKNQTVDNFGIESPQQHELLTRLSMENGFFVEVEQFDPKAFLKIGIFIPQDNRTRPLSWKQEVNSSLLRGKVWYWNFTDIREREICMLASPKTIRPNYGSRSDIHEGSSVGAYKDWNGSLHFVVDNKDLGIAVEKLPRNFFYGWLRFGSNVGKIKITHRMDHSLEYHYRIALSEHSNNQNIKQYPLIIKEKKKKSAAIKKEKKEVLSPLLENENDHDICAAASSANTNQNKRPEKPGLRVYRMTKKPRGHCLIISNSKFHDSSQNRSGADVDEKALNFLFTELHFIVTIKKDLTAAQINEQLHFYSQINHDNFDAFICVIMTHGKDDNILLGVDEETIKLEDLMSQVKPTNCPSLRAKPKFFIVQACRGNFREDIANSYCPNSLGKSSSYSRERAMFDMDGLSYLSTDSTLPRSICPIEGDFLLACATTPGYVALRDSKKGSIFVQVLIDVFRELHSQCHVVDLLVEVNRRVAEKVEEITDGIYWQIASPSLTLRGAFYL